MTAPPVVPLILPAGEWATFTQVLTRLDDLIRRLPPGPVCVITGSQVLAVITPETAAELAACAATVRGARHHPEVPARVKIGQRIRMRRVALGLTQDQLADRTEWTRQHIGEIERGEKDLTDGQLQALAAEVGTTAHKLRSM